MIESRILISLDSILDTRLSTAYCMNPKFVGEAIKLGYPCRELICPNGMDNDDFKQAYATRWRADKVVDVLKNSIATNILKHIEELSMTDNHRLINLVKRKPTKLVINFPVCSY